jgi:hypothetical protein
MTSSAPLEAAKTKRVEAGILLSFRPLMYDASKQVGELVLAKRFLRISLFGQRETRSGAELLPSASGLSFCCLAWFSISSLSAGGSRGAHVQRSASGRFFILAANSTILLIASARDGTSICPRRQSSAIRKKGSDLLDLFRVVDETNAGRFSSNGRRPHGGS